MALISLLISLATERILSSKYWHFNTYFSRYIKFACGFVSKDEISKSYLNVLLFAFIPSFIVWLVIEYIDHSIVHFVVSTGILMICFGCSAVRESYKNFLNSAMRGDKVAADHYKQELQQEKSLENESYGQTLVWLNYQYYLALMLIFILLGASAVVFYRILVVMVNKAVDDEGNEFLPDTASHLAKNLLHYLDFIPSRFVAFGYMLVGHFSKASTVWLEGLLNYSMAPRKYLCEVAKISEDCKVDENDLSAEPILLVKLAKRNVLLLLAATAFMTIAGVLS